LTRKYIRQHPVKGIRKTRRLNRGQSQRVIGKVGKFEILFKSSRKNKKYELWNGQKTVHFGQMGYEDYTKHHNKNRRRNYLNRSKKIRGNWKFDPYSPNNLAIHILW
jgi:hypothetical protein